MSRQLSGKTSQIKTGFILVLILLTGLIGCGPQTPEPVTITMVAGAVGNEYEVLAGQVAQFEAQHPDIQVQLLDLPESASDRHRAFVDRFKRQDPMVDVYMIDIVWPPEFGAAGWTLPLDEYIATSHINMADFLDGAVQGNTWDGHLVSMPWFIDAGLLYYRADLLAKYGFTPPQTWTELVEMAETIVAAEQETSPHLVGFVFQGRQYEGLVTNYLEYVWGNGATVLNKTGDQVVLKSPAAVEALEILIGMQAIAPPGIASFQEEDALNYFQSGHAVFMRNWPFAWAVLNEKSSLVHGQVGVAPLPHGPRGSRSISTLGGWQLGINAWSQHPEEAFELIAFLTSLEQQNYKAIHAGHPPARRASYQDPDVLAANPHLTELLDILIEARPRPVHPQYSDISNIIQQEVHRAMVGQQDAATATEAMASAIRSIIANSTQEAAP